MLLGNSDRFPLASGGRGGRKIIVHCLCMIQELGCWPEDADGVPIGGGI